MSSEFDPPPTVNTLNRHQRLRLIRSNRKLEAVLGTVPYYPEPELSDMALQESNTKASRRSGRIFGHSPSSSISASSISASSSTTSLSSMESYVSFSNKSSRSASPSIKQSIKSKSGTQLSRPLLLRLRSVPVRPSDTRATPLPQLHLITATSPISPKFTIDLEQLQSTRLEQRRKKMAKVIRTLGENIPPELVFRADDTEKPLKPRLTERKPIPTALLSSAPAPPRNTTQPPVISKLKPLSNTTTHTPSASAQHARTNPTTSQRSSNGDTPTHGRPQAPTLAERRRKTRPRSLSLSTGTDILAAAKICSDDELPPTTTQQPLANVVTPSISYQKATTVSKHSQGAVVGYTLTIDEKATRDIIQTRSPLAFQTTMTTHQHHRHAHSSPSNLDFDFNTTGAEAPVRGHSRSASVSRGPSASHPPSSFSQYGKRREHGWSGEWNQDLGEVVKVLRNMKAR